MKMAVDSIILLYNKVCKESAPNMKTKKADINHMRYDLYQLFLYVGPVFTTKVKV